MLNGPMQDVWDMFAMLQGDFTILLGTLGIVLVAGGGFYLAWITWRKYRTATSRI